MKESQLDNKTAIATNDYVRMVDENGNSVKIKKDSFMAAIRDALPSIISDGETGGGSVLSIINGALKTRTDANLASVLGVCNPLSFTQHFKNFLVLNGEPVDTGISVNASSQGRAIIAITSGHADRGVYTYSAIHLLRCGYDGNYLHVVEVAKSSYTNEHDISFTVSDSGTIVINSNWFLISCTLLSNKPF